MKNIKDFVFKQNFKKDTVFAQVTTRRVWEQRLLPQHFHLDIKLLVILITHIHWIVNALNSHNTFVQNHKGF